MKKKTNKPKYLSCIRVKGKQLKLPFTLIVRPPYYKYPEVVHNAVKEILFPSS